MARIFSQALGKWRNEEAKPSDYHPEIDEDFVWVELVRFYDEGDEAIVMNLQVKVDDNLVVNSRTLLNDMKQHEAIRHAIDEFDKAVEAHPTLNSQARARAHAERFAD